jgi:bZIP transcription factor
LEIATYLWETMTAGETAQTGEEAAAGGATSTDAKLNPEPSGGYALPPTAAAPAAAPAADASKGEESDEDAGEDDDGSEGYTGGGVDVARSQKKRKERLEQNRISARESRKRKKTMIEELQRTVITLSKENKDLNDRNEQLRSQLMDIGRKV